MTNAWAIMLAGVTWTQDVVNVDYTVNKDLTIPEYNLTIPPNAVTVEIVTNESPPMLEYEFPQWSPPWGTNAFYLNIQDTSWQTVAGTVKAKTVRFDEVRRKTLRLVWLKKERTLVDEEVLKSWSVRYELKTEERWIETTNAVPKVSDITDHGTTTNLTTITSDICTIPSLTNESVVTISGELIDAILDQIEKRKEKRGLVLHTNLNSYLEMHGCKP